MDQTKNKQITNSGPWTDYEGLSIVSTCHVLGHIYPLSCPSSPTLTIEAQNVSTYPKNRKTVIRIN